MKAIFVARYLATQSFYQFFECSIWKNRRFCTWPLASNFAKLPRPCHKKLSYGRKIIFKKRRFFVRKAPTWWRHKAMNTSLDQLFIWPKAWSQQLSFMAWVDFFPNLFGFESMNSTNSHDFDSKSVYPSCWCTFSATIFWILGAQKTTFPKFPKLENLVTIYLDIEWKFQKLS